MEMSNKTKEWFFAMLDNPEPPSRNLINGLKSMKNNKGQRVEMKDINELSSTQLKALVEDILQDLKEVSSSSPNSEEHMDCFAALCVVTEELKKRNLN